MQTSPGGRASRAAVKQAIVLAALCTPAVLIFLCFPPHSYRHLTFTDGQQHYYLSASHLFAAFHASLVMVMGYVVHVTVAGALGTLPRTASRLERVWNMVFPEQRLALLRSVARIAHSLAACAASLAMVVAGTWLFRVDALEVSSLTVDALWASSLLSKLLRIGCLTAFVNLATQVAVLKVANYFHREFYAERLEANVFAVRCVLELKERFKPMADLAPPGSPASVVVASLVGEQDVAVLAHHLFEHLTYNTDELIVSVDSDSVTVSPRHSVSSSCPDQLTVGHLIPVLGEEKGHRFFACLDRQHKGVVARKEFALGIENVLKEESLLERSIAANNRVLDRLSQLFFAASLFFLFTLTAPLLSKRFVPSMATVGTVFFTFQFLFSKDIASAFTGLFFVIVTHPFDIGDLIRIDDGEELLFVEDIGLWESQLRGSQRCLTYMTNASLAKRQIANLRRSDPMREACIIEVDGATTNEQIDALGSELARFAKENEKDFDAPSISGFTFINSAAFQFRVSVAHKSNFYDRDLMCRRSKLWVMGVKDSLKAANIQLASFDWEGHWANS